ncbi:TPA: ABC transporter ATP-binding protein [Raoultella planticola]
MTLNINQVSHSFRMQQDFLPVLKNVSLTVRPGEFIALLGPSGCGKSTLLRLIAGLETPQEGEITDNNGIITAPSPSRIVVFQDPTLYPWLTVRDNVALGMKIGRKTRQTDIARVNEMLEKVGLADFSQAWPHQLSGGMAQRTALARALVNDPETLLLDEPLGKLDSLTRIRMQREIIDLWHKSGVSIIMVTHDVEEALLMANRIVVFSPRPARVIEIIEPGLSWPRHRDDPELISLRTYILSLLEYQ